MKTILKLYVVLAVLPLSSYSLEAIAPVIKNKVDNRTATGIHPMPVAGSLLNTKRTTKNQGNQLNSVVYWSDDFSDSTRWIKSSLTGPDNWVIDYTLSGPTGVFAIAPIASQSAANGFALFDSDLLCSGDQIANLETAGLIDLSSASTARVVFSQYYRRYIDSTFLFVSNDSGATWSKISINTNTANNNYNSSNSISGQTNPEIVRIDISSIAAGHSGVKLRFQFYSPASLGAGAGCAYAWMLDDIFIEDYPLFDLRMEDIVSPNEYTCMPLSHIQPLTFAGRVFNDGSSTATNAQMSISVFDLNNNTVFSGTSNVIGSIAPGDTSPLLSVGIPFTPIDTGTYTIRYVCSMSATDLDPTNDTIVTNFRVDDVMFARDATLFDQAYFMEGVGFNMNDGYMGHVFEFNSMTQLTSSEFWLNAPTVGDSISVEVFEFLNGVPTSLIGSSGDYLITANDTGGKFIQLPFVNSIIVTSGQYFVAVHQKSTNNITLGMSWEIFTPGKSFYRFQGGSWTPLGNFMEGCFMLRVNTAGMDHYPVLGSVYFDYNGNGIRDAGEASAGNRSVWILPDSLSSISSPVTGFYGFYLENGNYIDSLEVPSGWHTTTPSTYSITVNDSGISGLDFGIQPDQYVPAEVLGTLCPPFPRCLTQRTYSLNLLNNGWETATGIASFVLDPLMSYVSASPVPDSISANTLYWHYGPLQAGQNAPINVNVIIPAGPGQILTTLNVWTADSAGNSMMTDNDTLIQTIACSYDPNDKAVNPPGTYQGGVFYPDLVSEGTSLEYQIRFQNTGNDTAYVIVVRDTLDPQLDLATLEILGSSHDMTVNIGADRVLTFNFNNIYLPDSFVDEPGSHGFVQYRLRPLSGTPLPFDILNTAYIYFDLNSPVVTNTTLSHYDFPAGITYPASESDSKDILLVPNPSSGDFIIRIPQEIESPHHVIIRNAIGEVVRDLGIFEGQEIPVKRNHLPSGIYFIAVQDVTDNTMSVRKMILR